MSPERTLWNGQPCETRRVIVRVGDHGRFPKAWFKSIVGQEIPALEVTYAGDTFYLDDRDDYGWRKVTVGRGTPQHGHRSLDVAEVLGER